MICRNCQQNLDEQEGQTYIFYYGNETGRTAWGRSSTIHYKIGGSTAPFLCNTCVFAYTMQRREVIYRNWGFVFLLVGGIVALLMLFGSDGNMGEIPWLVAGLVLAYTLALFLLGMVERRRTGKRDFAHLPAALRSLRGSTLAIAIGKDDWRARGYNAFFTPQHMQRIKHPARIPARS
jgi:hypothetical protein